MPRWRSLSATARPARPRSRCCASAYPSANAASSINPTSVKRSNTLAAASSGTPRARSASASSVRVRARRSSRRRQMARATDSGASGGPSSAPPLGTARRPSRGTPSGGVVRGGRPGADISEVDRGRDHIDGRSLVHPSSDTELLLDPLLDLIGEVRVVAQEVAHILLALAELVGFVGAVSYTHLRAHET